MEGYGIIEEGWGSGVDRGNERQHKSHPHNNDVGVRSRSGFNLRIERRIQDQASRDLRLSNRMGSPLGLTIEELDDRGLLDGGAIYSSSRQRGRRPLEMRKRSSRLLERGKEVIIEKLFSFKFNYYGVIMVFDSYSS